VDAKAAKHLMPFSTGGEFVGFLSHIPRRTEALLTRLEQGRLDVRSQAALN
jgi:hypothetical protein